MHKRTQESVSVSFKDLHMHTVLVLHQKALIDLRSLQHRSNTSCVCSKVLSLTSSFSLSPSAALSCWSSRALFLLGRLPAADGTPPPAPTPGPSPPPPVAFCCFFSPPPSTGGSIFAAAGEPPFSGGWLVSSPATATVAAAAVQNTAGRPAHAPKMRQKHTKREQNTAVEG